MNETYGGAEDEPGGRVEVRESGVRYEVDLGRGQKTGFYADQRENRPAGPSRRS